MKFTRTEVLSYSISGAIFTSFFAFLLGLDFKYFFWFGLSIAYLNMEIQDRFWSWWRNTPPFMGWRYWVNLSLKVVKQK